MGNSFRFFWEAMQNGDRIMQEKIMNDYIGIFYLLKKHKYVEICMLQIEREYKSIKFKSLQEIGMNMAFRYKHERKKLIIKNCTSCS